MVLLLLLSFCNSVLRLVLDGWLESFLAASWVSSHIFERSDKTMVIIFTFFEERHFLLDLAEPNDGSEARVPTKVKVLHVKHLELLLGTEDLIRT